jgi:hypothetical protein
VVDVDGDEAVPGANGDDDEVCTVTASKMVQVARSIGSWWRAIAWLKAAVSVELARANLMVWSRSCCGFRVRRERGGYLCRGAGLG